VGVIDGDAVIDVTDHFDTAPSWPLPHGDWIARQIGEAPDRAHEALPGRPRLSISSVRLDAPIANPGKIIGAPVNYRAHQAEAAADSEINLGREIPQIGQLGLFLKATSALLGPSEEIRLAFPDRRNDHEVELVAVIGKEGRHIPREQALDHVLGYAIGLDMTVRGLEFPSFRKSIDTYAVLGPWIVTADEITNPGNLNMRLAVNGAPRQKASTRDMIFDTARLIEYASSFYTLHPGDLIFTGTPEGVSEVRPGDILDAEIEGVGAMRIAIAKEYSQPRA
jgi:2-keto-4-pentenoate hydratase/2-oxohepta-3-ene-1,7-dioic acid hydratase in catechol pathway